MRIAVMTDVHANLPALEAALKAIAAEGYDAIYHTGDAIGIGPFPAETLDRLLHTPRMQPVMGNHDALFGANLLEPKPDWMDEGEYRHQHWTQAQLDPALRQVVAGWPYVVEQHFAGLPVSFLHYGLDETGMTFLPIVPEPTAADLDRLFEGQHSSGLTPQLLFYGHHHPYSDSSGHARYINPGSLGCNGEAKARYALLDISADGSYTLSQRAVPYDDSQLLQELERRQVPEGDFIRRIFYRR